jgi:plastocyanin
MTGFFRRSRINVRSANVTGRIAVSLLIIVTLAACSSTGAPAPSGTVVSPATSPGNSTESPTPGDSAIEVTGVEYAYQGVPEMVPAGTVVSFFNAGEEVHQIVAVRRNEGVTTSLDELLAMPEGESNKLVTFLDIAVAGPGETAPNTITLDQPGSYIFVCFIPVGTTALPSLAPGATPNADTLPDGKPHFLEGMVAEFSATAATSNTSPSSPSSTTATSAGADIFESTRHSYRVEVPANWVVNEYPGAWEDLAQFTPGGEIPGEDAIAPRDFSSFLVMNSMPIPAGMSPAEWGAAFEAIVATGLPADCSTTTRSEMFAGEPATIVEQSCADVAVVGRSLVHGGRGYYFTTLSPHPDPAGVAVVAEMAASIEFTK